MTEQELQDFLEKLAKGCKWYDEHPECFRLYDNGFMIEIIDENIPEEARFYVEFSNKQTLADREKAKMLDAAGLRSPYIHAKKPPKHIKFGKWED